MDFTWFEMRDVRKKRFDSAVWIPLRASQHIEKRGDFAHLGYGEEFFGAGSIAVPLSEREAAENLGWTDVGIGHDHHPYIEDGKYIPADTYLSFKGDVHALSLVLDQRGSSIEHREWHLHQDLVIGLRLLREGDAWLAMDEGYIEVARLKRDEGGSPILLEVRAEYLKDYLRAREMALYLNTYRSRVEVVSAEEKVPWREAPPSEVDALVRWEGRAWDVHEGGWTPFGEQMAVFHSGRTDIAPDEDVPTLGEFGEGELESSSWRVGQQAKRVTRVEGELWRSEWVEPAPLSPRIRADKVPSTISYVIDAAGSRELSENLTDGGRWLWFEPDVMMALAHRRGGGLTWYTRDTGGVWCSPGHAVDFGVNDLGLITVYAKDVALLPEWQQRIWLGHNLSPEGGISKELHASQVRADPANTYAPEALIPQLLEFLTKLGVEKFGFSFILNHEAVTEILPRVHRFRALNREGLFALAKDVARVLVDNIDAAALQKIVKPPKDKKWGSLKSLENVVALRLGPDMAREALGPIVGAYELRHADAHLPGSAVETHLKLARIDEHAPFVTQGFQLLASSQASLTKVARALTELEPEHLPKC